jgi:hypothetical protein
VIITNSIVGESANLHGGCSKKIHFQALATTVWLAGARATPKLHLQEHKIKIDESYN